MTRGHVVIITKTESTYVMIESTLRFDDVKIYQAFSGGSKVAYAVKRTERETQYIIHAEYVGE